MENRLNALDRTFLDLESPSTPMHVSACLIYPEKPFQDKKGYIDFDNFCKFVSSKLHLIPRYRQKIMTVPLAQGRPIWVDDDTFNLRYHLRHTALPRPGTMKNLKELIGQITSIALDRNKPLWEFWFVEGLEGGRIALISKIHHAMIDGVSGVDLAAILIDWSSKKREIPAPLPWEAKSAPTKQELLVSTLSEKFEKVGGFINSVNKDQAGLFLKKLGEITEGLKEFGGELAPKSPLNRRIGHHRMVDWVTLDLKRLKEIKNCFGGTLNDTILTIISGALRRFFMGNDSPINPNPLKVLIPVSTRKEEERGTLGNQVSMMILDMPIHIVDVKALHTFIKERMGFLKKSKQVMGAKAITSMSNVAISTILHQASKMQWQQRIFNTVVTNVPGPQMPLYMNGAEMESVAPFVPLGPNIAMGFAIFSYNGGITIGVNADSDAFKSLSFMVSSINEAIEDMENYVKESAQKPNAVEAAAK